MSENSKEQTSVTGLVALTGGLISCGAIGWSLFTMFESPQFDYKEIMCAVSVAGGMGILSSAIFFKFLKSSGSQRKSIISIKEASNLTIPACETFALRNLLDRVNEWDKIFAQVAGNGNVLDNKISRNMKQVDEVTSKYEDLSKRLNYLNQQGQVNKLQNLPADNQMKSCCNEGIGSSKAKFREEIISHINELKGYVQGTIDPLPLAKNINIRSTEKNDEKSRQIAMIVKEYADSMLPRLEQVIEKFVHSVHAAGKDLDDKEHKVKNALETLGVPEKDLLTAPLKTEMNQYYNALEKATKSKSQIPSGQNCTRSRHVTGANERPLGSVSSNSLQEIVWTKTAELQSPMMPKMKTSTGVSMPFKPQEVNKPGHRAVEKIKSAHSKPPSKLVLNQEQMKYLNILKSELQTIMVS